MHTIRHTGSSVSAWNADARAQRADAASSAMMPPNVNPHGHTVAVLDAPIASHQQYGMSPSLLPPGNFAPATFEQLQRRSSSSTPESTSMTQANAFEALAMEKQSLELQAERIRIAQAQVAIGKQALELDVTMQRGSRNGSGMVGINKHVRR